MRKTLPNLVLVLFLAICPAVASAERIELVRQGKAVVSLAESRHPSEAEVFAGGELTKYFLAISTARLSLGTRQTPHITFDRGDAIGVKLAGDDYAIAIRKAGVILAGETDRARLFAVYDLLERLGCRWLAPEFGFYKGDGEFIPAKQDLVLDLPGGIVVERPDFKIRKLDVEEGLSHTTENLKQLVAWAPKLRYNTLMVPRDYNGTGRVTWDQWRAAITPEAKKRGLIIEVGGHGYENFLNAEMNGGKFFADHPEWFGQDEQGKRSKLQRQVFCTSNDHAVEFVTKGVIEYLNTHPEIDVFQLWPPDGADWCTCNPCKMLGEPQDRQALLINYVQKIVEKEKPGVRLEIIAYSKALLPPAKVKLDERILVDFCPINQCFEVPIDNPASDRNKEYAAAIKAWRKQFAGDIGLYSYYRKYAWKSLPALIPHYMQADLRFYRTLPLQATMIYGEPGDWASYEINHYALGKLSWRTEIDIDAMLRTFCEARYGREHADQAANALAALGDAVRGFGSLPFTSLKSPEQLDAAEQKLRQIADKFPKDNPAFHRLSLSFEYAARDLQLQRARAANAPEPERRKQIESLVQFLMEHKEDGMFIIRDRNAIDGYLKRYGLR